jgi:UPF0716 protein FxsA
MFLASPLFWLFVVIPLVEVALFSFVGGRIGILATLAVVIATAAVGAILVKAQGLAVLGRAQANMSRGVMPATELIEGVMILAAGLLLLTPGFLTDAMGFSLLVPGVRLLLRATVLKRMTGQAQASQGPFSRGPRASEIEIIDESPSNERDPDDR